MKENISDFIKRFNAIKEKGWIKGCVSGKGNIGRTFENELGCSENSLEIPDYNGIEIKTKLNFKKNYITLFTCKSESKFYNNTDRLKELYGYYDKELKNYKVLNTAAYCTRKVIINSKYQFKLNIDRNDKRIYLYVYDLKNNLIDKSSYWDFDTLEEKINRKLKILAIIKANKTIDNGCEYFKYRNMYMYKFKSFNNFIDLIENGKIRICFKVGLYKSGNKFGKTYDHGTGFEIKECNLLEMYDKIDINNYK